MERRGSVLPLRLLRRCTRRSAQCPTNARRFTESQRAHWEEHWRIGQSYARSNWNTFSDKSLLWRKDPSEIEAQLAIAVSGLFAAGSVLSVVVYLALSTDKWFEPPENTADLKDVETHEETAVYTIPGAFKSDDSHFCRLLYKNHIRVLVLHPGRFDDDIHFHMGHISLGERHPAFEALSYTWGDRTATEIIHGPDKAIPVTANLHSALRHLRYEDQTRRLWVDALCIDQTDIDERNQQIRLMGDVFSEADRVVVWLGEKSADTAKAFTSLQKLHYISYLQKSPEGGFFRHIVWTKEESDSVLQRTVAMSVIGHVVTSNLRDVDWNSIKSLLHRPWFHRLWVIQEVTHAKRAVVVCGDAVFSWKTFSEALVYLVEHDLTSKYLDKKCAHACNNVVNITRMRHQKTRDPLFKVILENAYGGCADPRDKIFAMMSISEGRDIFDWEIAFDYNLYTTELFKRFAIWDIMRNRSLRSLSCATTGKKDYRLPPPLPSWVPDWTRILDTDLLVCYKDTSKFSASQKTECDVWFTHNKERMHVRGAIVDYIHIVGMEPSFIKTTSVFEIDEGVMTELASMNRWLQDCWMIAKGDKPMTTGRYKAFWMTMLCGLDGSGYPAPKAYSKYFQRYFTFMRQAPMVLDKFLKSPDPVLPTQLSSFSMLAKFCDVTNSSKESYAQIRSRMFHEWFNENFKTNSLIEESLKPWAKRAERAGKRFCRTEDGRLARVPENAAIGDSICILHGSEVPYVLRLQGDGTFTVIGECYVHGIMHGEALGFPSYQTETFRLR